MSVVPAWLAAVASQPAQAGQINQFLGAHPTNFLYAGTRQAAQTTAGSGTVGTFNTYLAQTFTTGAAQTAIGYVTAAVAETGTAPTSTVQISIYATAGGAPTGAPLVSVTAAPEYVTFAGGGLVVFPVPVTGLTAGTTYAIVIGPSGASATQDYTWAKSNQTSGAYTSANGSSWAAQAYGFQFAVYDQSALGQLVATFEDAGARWTALTYNTNGTPHTLSEYTAAQGGGYLQATRTFTYSGTQLTAVS